MNNGQQRATLNDTNNAQREKKNQKWRSTYWSNVYCDALYKFEALPTMHFNGKALAKNVVLGSNSMRNQNTPIDQPTKHLSFRTGWVSESEWVRTGYKCICPRPCVSDDCIRGLYRNTMEWIECWAHEIYYLITYSRRQLFVCNIVFIISIFVWIRYHSSTTAAATTVYLVASPLLSHTFSCDSFGRLWSHERASESSASIQGYLRRCRFDFVISM